MLYRVHVIVPCFNGAKYILDCLNSINDFSLLNQDKEIICLFIDDGSFDKTEEIVKQTIEKKRNYELLYFYQQNKGLPSARNTGIRYVIENYNDQNNFILFLDVDDYLNALHVNIDNSFDVNIYNYQIENKQYTLKEHEINNLSVYNPFVVSCIISRINNLLFDESLKALEDWDYWITRILEEKNSVVFHKESITKIRRVLGSMSSDKARMNLNRSKVAKKHLDKKILDLYHRKNMIINSMFNNITFLPIVKAFFIVFPFIFRRNFLSLVINIFYNSRLYNLLTTFQGKTKI